jgi:hypothetical protein
MSEHKKGFDMRNNPQAWAKVGPDTYATQEQKSTMADCIAVAGPAPGDMPIDRFVAQQPLPAFPPAAVVKECLTTEVGGANRDEFGLNIFAWITAGYERGEEVVPGWNAVPDRAVAAAPATPPASAQAVAPAQVEQEPIGYAPDYLTDRLNVGDEGVMVTIVARPQPGFVDTPIYTRPQAAQPAAKPIGYITTGDAEGDEIGDWDIEWDRKVIDAMEEFALPEATYAVYLEAKPAVQKLRPMGEGDEWYFDCDGHYIDVARDSAGKYSVYFRNQVDGSEAFHDQAQPAAQVAVLTDADVRAAGGIIHRDGNVFFANIEALNRAILAAKSAPADGGGV